MEKHFRIQKIVRYAVFFVIAVKKYDGMDKNMCPCFVDRLGATHRGWRGVFERADERDSGVI